MARIVGIDLGTNSLGTNLWDKNDSGILRDNTWQYVDVFKNGVSKGSYMVRESSLAAQCRGFRNTRHRLRSVRARKQATLKHLIKYGYCPLSMEALEKWRFEDEEKGYDRTFPTDARFMSWIGLDFDGDGKADYSSVYELRNELMERDFDFNETTDRYKLGRALYHMACHRGFKSSKGSCAGEEDNLDNERAHSESERAEEIEKLMAENGLKTIGQAFYYIEKTLGERVRNHAVYKAIRIQYKEEIDEIFKRQSLPMDDDPFYQGLVSTKRHEGTIFYKKPVRKGKKGKCFLEPTKPRCYVSHPEFEEFRALQLINNIRIRANKDEEWQMLDEGLRQQIYQDLFLNSVRGYFRFDEIRNYIEEHLDLSLSKKGGTINYKDDTTVMGCPVTVRLKRLFGKDFTAVVAKTVEHAYTVEDVWHICNTADDEGWILNFARTTLQFEDNKVKQLRTLWDKMPDGYSNLSLKAIRRINVMLRMGLRYDEAVMFANIPVVMGKERFDNIKDSIPDINSRFLEEYNAKKIAVKTENKRVSEYFQAHQEDRRTSSLRYQKQPVKIEYLKAFLSKEFPEIRPKMWSKLYHHSDISFYPTPSQDEDGNRYLGDPVGGRMMPPAVKHALFVLKHRINELIESGEVDENTRFVVETAREMCDANQKWAIDTYNERREQEKKKIKDLIKEKCASIQNPSDEDARVARLLLEQGEKLNEQDEKVGDRFKTNVSGEKYKLWKEQDYLSIYTGYPIPIEKLFTSAYDIEHTLPISKSFDDSLANKTICESTYNRDPRLKGNNLPTECPNYKKAKDNLPGYPKGVKAIKDSVVLQRWADKVERLKEHVKHWDNRAKTAPDEEKKNECLRQKYVYRMELDYWEGKLDRFFMTEIDEGFLHSQLNDTRIITRYAYHYLKSVFPKVSVERGETTAIFRRILGIERDDEKNSRKKAAAANEWTKDRTLHYHHAIDALVLSLIPHPEKRDKIMSLYYEAIEAKKLRPLSKTEEAERKAEVDCLNEELRQEICGLGISIREVRDVVKRIKSELIVHHERKDNKMARDVRKIFKDGRDTGRRKQGDVVKGNLHKDSLYGAIRLPILDEKGKPKGGRFIYSDIVGGAGVKYVIRISIYDERLKLDQIVDPQVRWSIEEQMKRYGIKNLSSAIDKPMWMMKKVKNADGTEVAVLCDKDKHGRPLAPIRHVRCFFSGKDGNIISTVRAERQSKKSLVNLPNRTHKERIYVEKGDYICCIIYRGTDEKGKAKHGFYFLTDMDLAKLKRDNRQVANRCRSLREFVMELPELEERRISIHNKKKKTSTVYNMHRLSVVLPGTMIRLKDDGTGKSVSERTFVVRTFNYSSINGSIIKTHHSIADNTDDKYTKEIGANTFVENYEIVE